MANFGLVIGDFHASAAQVMEEEATAAIREGGHSVERVVMVPGSYETPLALKALLADAAIDAAVVLGIIERGETAHGLVMANAVMPKILDLQLETLKPVGIGILGPEIFPSQIEPRIRPYARAAAAAAIRMLALKG
jgi:6,7-dimethyl-8-ribityllumazine synthase